MQYFILNIADVTQAHYDLCPESSGTVRKNLANTQVVLKSSTIDVNDSNSPFYGETPLFRSEIKIEMAKTTWSPA